MEESEPYPLIIRNKYWNDIKSCYTHINLMIDLSYDVDNNALF